MKKELILKVTLDVQGHIEVETCDSTERLAGVLGGLISNMLERGNADGVRTLTKITAGVLAFEQTGALERDFRKNLDTLVPKTREIFKRIKAKEIAN